MRADSGGKHSETGGGGGDGHDDERGSKMNYGRGDNAAGARVLG